MLSKIDKDVTTVTTSPFNLGMVKQFQQWKKVVNESERWLSTVSFWWFKVRISAELLIKRLEGRPEENYYFIGIVLEAKRSQIYTISKNFVTIALLLVTQNPNSFFTSISKLKFRIGFSGRFDQGISMPAFECANEGQRSINAFVEVSW